jgi:hypothetical protein
MKNKVISIDYRVFSWQIGDSRRGDFGCGIRFDRAGAEFVDSSRVAMNVTKCLGSRCAPGELATCADFRPFLKKSQLFVIQET